MNRKKIIVFFALISLGIYTGCSGQGQETEKSDTEQPKEFLQRDSVLYQKYQDALQEIDERREACLILGEDGWENAKDCYREFISENLFGMCALYNAGSGYEMNEMTGILAANQISYPWGANTGFELRIAVSEVDEIWEYGYYEYNYSDMQYFTC